MPLRTRLFIIASIVIFAVLAISLFIVVGSKKAKKSATNTARQSDGQTAKTSDTGGGALVFDQNGNVVTSSQVVVLPATNVEAEKNGVRQTAKIFLERYGSYSTDNKQQNIKEVKSMVSDSLWSELSKRIGAVSAGGFVGVTTNVITSKIAYWSDGAATIKLSATREETKDGAVKSTQHNATVYLIKSGSQWLVDKFEWK